MIFLPARHGSDVLPLGKEVWEYGFTTPEHYGCEVGEWDVGHGGQKMCSDAGQPSARKHVKGV